jgi:pSer/pThr/pTyr-binding forkhead associated (FHA) protein
VASGTIHIAQEEGAMSWSVLPLTGSHRGTAFPLRPLPFTIGHDVGCHLRAKSPQVAARHCTLYQFDGQLTVENHDTGEATFLDGVPVLGPTYVAAASVLQVGPLFFKLCQADAVGLNAPSLEDQAAAVLEGTE